MLIPGAHLEPGAEARVQIEDVVKKYATAVDERDWQKLAECFTEEAIGNYIGMAYLEGRQAIVDWVASKVGNAELTMHVMSNIEVTVAGERASSRCYGTAYLKFPSGPGSVLATRGIVYTDELKLVHGQWRISQRTHEARFMTYAPELSPDQLKW